MSDCIIEKSIQYADETKVKARKDVLDRYRLIATIVVLFVYLLAMYPWQTIVVSVFLVLG